MNKKFFFIFFALFVFILLTWQVSFYFNNAASLSSKNVKGVEAVSDPIAGIVPHHLLAYDIIDNFFQNISSADPKTIVLIGPNHFEKGDFNVLTSKDSWQTDKGIVLADGILIQKFINSGLVKEDKEVLNQEHSVYEITPFIKQYFPNALLFPIILSGKSQKHDLEQLGDKLLKVYDQKDLLIIASVDFSHYLKDADASSNDLITLKYIKDYDYQNILMLNSDYLDSPPSIALLLYIMQKKGDVDLEVLDHTNSAKLLDDDYLETTSYFSMLFYSNN